MKYGLPSCAGCATGQALALALIPPRAHAAGGRFRRAACAGGREKGRCRPFWLGPLAVPEGVAWGVNCSTYHIFKSPKAPPSTPHGFGAGLVGRRAGRAGLPGATFCPLCREYLGGGTRAPVGWPRCKSSGELRLERQYRD